MVHSGVNSWSPRVPSIIIFVSLDAVQAEDNILNVPQTTATGHLFFPLEQHSMVPLTASPSEAVWCSKQLLPASAFLIVESRDWVVSESGLTQPSSHRTIIELLLVPSTSKE